MLPQRMSFRIRIATRALSITRNPPDITQRLPRIARKPAKIAAHLNSARAKIERRDQNQAQT
jgi:hypothetical protein